MTLDIDALLARAGLSGLQSIALEQIISHPDNPRRNFDAAELDALAASIRERGLLQPVTVYPADGQGRHILRFGERRVRAARLAGLAAIDAIICEAPARTVQIIDQIVENDQRVGLSPLEMSRAIAALTDAGMTQAAVATQLGRSPATISLYAAVGDMPPFLQSLSDQVTIRPLYDLYGHWRRNPACVEGFVATTPADQISRRTVGALARVDGIDAGVVEASSPIAVASSRLAPAACPNAPGVDTPPLRGMTETGRVRVRHGDREGTLLFLRAAADHLLVRFDGEERAVPVDPTHVIIIAATCAGPTRR